jgi:4,5-dihydroxyphthalate decarboxylase
MSHLQLSLACGPYDLLYALIEGKARASGVDFSVMTMASPERHGRLLRHHEFDVCELSLGSYIVAREAGLPYTAIPVFPHRRFRHRYCVKRMGCGIEKPADLNGRRVGLDTLQNSAGLWMRGILQDHYGVDLRSIEWWCQEEEDIPFQPAAWLRIKRVREGQDIDRMLVAGELDAAIYPDTLPSIRSRNPAVGALFADPKQAEIEYFRAGGHFPIMHTVVIRNSVLEQHPWVAVNVMQAFQQSKEACYARLRNPRNTSLAWIDDALREQESVMGKDAWPYGLAPNVKALEAAIRWTHEHGMIRKKPKVEELFFPASLQDVQHYL